MRTFIAIRIIPETKLLHAVADLKTNLADEPLKWVNEQNLHLTLKFLGDTSGKQVHQVKNILAKIARQFQPVTVKPAGIGYFKSRGVPRVLFVNIHDKANLQKLAATLDEELMQLGFQSDKRPFNPHLTIARIKFPEDKNAFYNAIEIYKDLILQPVTVSEIIYFQSVLSPSGSVYHELAKFTFTGTY